MSKKASKSTATVTKVEPATKPVKAGKRSGGKPVAKAADKSKPKTAAKALTTAAKPVKRKRIHGSFSMPERDYALIAGLKARSKKRGRIVKKNELLRAGLRALTAMNDDLLLAAVNALDPVDSTARPAD
jgi:hypothetical protein